MKLLRGWEFDELEEKSSATEKRNSYLYTSMANVLEPYSPGERPKGSRYIYNWWTETSSFKSKFTEATLGKSPVRGNYLDHFLFLTDEETVELGKWASEKGKNIRKIDLDSCREFWNEFVQ